MKRNTALKILNPILAVLVLTQLVTGLSGASLPHEVFEVMHGGGALLLAAGILLHVALNANWIKANYTSHS